MKITRARLQQIIREELKIVNEQEILYLDESNIVSRLGDVVRDAGDAAIDAGNTALDAVDDFVDTVLENPEVVSGASLATKGVGLGLAAIPHPAAAAAGVGLINSSAALDAIAAAGYKKQGEYNAAAFSALGAGLSVNRAVAKQFYRQVTKLRNIASKNPSTFLLVKKRAPAWAWVGASATMEATLQSAEAALESEEDQDAAHIKRIEGFIKDVKENKKFFEQIAQAEESEHLRDFYHTQTGY